MTEHDERLVRIRATVRDFDGWLTEHDDRVRADERERIAQAEEKGLAYPHGAIAARIARNGAAQ